MAQIVGGGCVSVWGLNWTGLGADAADGTWPAPPDQVCLMKPRILQTPTHTSNKKASHMGPSPCDGCMAATARATSPDSASCVPGRRLAGNSRGTGRPSHRWGPAKAIEGLGVVFLSKTSLHDDGGSGVGGCSLVAKKKGRTLGGRKQLADLSSDQNRVQSLLSIGAEWG